MTDRNGWSLRLQVIFQLLEAYITVDVWMLQRGIIVFIVSTLSLVCGTHMYVFIVYTLFDNSCMFYHYTGLHFCLLVFHLPSLYKIVSTLLQLGPACIS